MIALNIKQNKELRDKNYIRIINKKIKSYIKNPFGSLSLSSSPIQVLPNNLKYIDGNLNISDSVISQLPKGLVVNGSLWCNYTIISTLPDDIAINGHLFCYDTPLSKKYTKSELRNKYKIKGDIYGIKY